METDAYCIGIVKQVPLAVVTTAVYGALVYYLAGLNDDGWYRFAYFLLVIVLCNLVGLSFCQVLYYNIRCLTFGTFDWLIDCSSFFFSLLLIYGYIGGP